MKRFCLISFITVIGSAAAIAARVDSPDGAAKYLQAVQTFADNVLEHGRDRFGPKHTPLFIDGINVDTHEPATWRRNGEEWVLSNLASQQVLIRTFVGLSALTGDPRYKQAAVDATRYAFDNLRSPNGLLYWGGHWCYDALHEKEVGEAYRHELKSNYPFYEFMWEVDPGATKRFLEAFWAAHILDWSRLDMNRHGSYEKQPGKLWEHEYEGGPVFFVGKGLTFVNTGSDLIYAAGMLHEFTGEEEPLAWSKRMARRYVETRNPKTGLGGYQYSQVERDRAQAQFGPEFGEKILEGTILEPNRSRRKFATAGICQLLLGETIGEPPGRDFIRWAADDLAAYGRHAYNPEANTFRPMISDGTDLTGYEMKRDGYYGDKGDRFEPAEADPIWFWAHALAWRLTGESEHWGMARSIGRGNGLGDIGESPGVQASLDGSTECSDPLALFGLLEIQRATKSPACLRAAQRVGDNILKQRFHKGFFLPSKNHLYARFDSVEALALLHLAAALRGEPDAVPAYCAGRAYLHCPFDGIGRTYDTVAIYSRRRD